jgi:hypothetical protein
MIGGRLMADWQDIKTEYITTKTSFRKLADKHGLNKDTIWKKAKEEGWDDLRRQHIDNVQTKILDADTEQKVDRAVRLMTVADKLLDKVEQWVEMSDPISATQIKNLSDAIKNIKEVQMIRTEEDIAEQNARIAKLHKEAENEKSTDNTIIIQFAAGAEEYAK